MNKTFKKQELEALDLPWNNSAGLILEDKIVGHRRWSVDHLLTFRMPDMPDGQAWQTTYSVGATESQDEGPWEYQDDVVCTLVHMVPKTIMTWEPVQDGE